MKVKNLNLIMKKNLLLDSMSFDISDNTALIGPNGAGKTMTLCVISQLIIPDSGSLTLNNSDSNLLHDSSFKQKIGVMIQESQFDNDKKVIDELNFIKALKNDKKTDIKAILKKAKIDPESQLKTLPNGKYKILLILQALLGNPELVLLDEPFTGLDAINKNIVIDMLKNCSAKLLIASHMLSDVKKLCNKIVFIKEGKTIQQKNMKQVKKLEKYYIKLYS